MIRAKKDKVSMDEITGFQVLVWNHLGSPTDNKVALTIRWLGFAGGSDRKEFTCNAENLGSISWVGKIPWRRAWQPTPVFFPREFPWTEEPGGLQSMELQRVKHY